MATVFLAAVAYKVGEFQQFSRIVGRMTVVRWAPVWSHAAVAGMVFGCEAFLGAMLLWGREARVVAAMTAVVLVGFTSAISIDLGHGTPGCGCFWEFGGVIPNSLAVILARNGVLTVAAVYVFRAIEVSGTAASVRRTGWFGFSETR